MSQLSHDYIKILCEIVKRFVILKLTIFYFHIMNLFLLTRFENPIFWYPKGP